jgi:hypothetical protein
VAALDRNAARDPLDRYLAAVRRFLPKGQQDDIVRELGGNLRSQMEDQEAELGRALSREEQSAILKRLGHPILVAGRYRTDEGSVAFGGQLIGPSLFPLYTRVLGLNLAISVAVLIAGAVTLRAVAVPMTLGDMVSAALRTLLIQFGVITAIFTLAQRYVARLGDRWDPRDPLSLREVVKDTMAHPAASLRVPRFESFLELVVLVIVFVWLLEVPESASRIFGSATSALHLARVWRQVIPPLLALPLVGIAAAALTLLRPQWTVVRAVARVIIGGAWLALLLVLLRAGSWFVLGTEAGSDGPRMLAAANQYCAYILAITAAASAGAFTYDIVKLLRKRA